MVLAIVPRQILPLLFSMKYELPRGRCKGSTDPGSDEGPARVRSRKKIESVGVA